MSDDGAMRIHRALARAGVASRRKAEELVAAGRVMVNGAPARTGQTVHPVIDTITLDGRRVGAPVAPVWFVLHKPAGVLTSQGDPRGRRTVFDLLPHTPGLAYVGRLDYLTEGVLLFTTDGDAAHRLTHPSSEIERSYSATVRGDALTAARHARRGVMLEDGAVHPVAVDAIALGEHLWRFDVTIREGRNREVRRLCEALDLEVRRLVRTRFGPITLGALAPGDHRPLTATEQRAIAALTESA
ncbi:MAG: rRNA pseudouridine synthase [Gemmatimonadaceae bacterium]|nr:rRNA pseudouridine synthase [Gemmatimonadaceae bacterium]